MKKKDSYNNVYESDLINDKYFEKSENINYNLQKIIKLKKIVQK